MTQARDRWAPGPRPMKSWTIASASGTSSEKSSTSRARSTADSVWPSPATLRPTRSAVAQSMSLSVAKVTLPLSPAAIESNVSAETLALGLLPGSDHCRGPGPALRHSPVHAPIELLLEDAVEGVLVHPATARVHCGRLWRCRRLRRRCGSLRRRRGLDWGLGRRRRHLLSGLRGRSLLWRLDLDLTHGVSLDGWLARRGGGRTLGGRLRRGRGRRGRCGRRGSCRSGSCRALGHGGGGRGLGLGLGGRGSVLRGGRRRVTHLGSLAGEGRGTGTGRNSARAHLAAEELRGEPQVANGHGEKDKHHDDTRADGHPIDPLGPWSQLGGRAFSGRRSDLHHLRIGVAREHRERHHGRCDDRGDPCDAVRDAHEARFYQQGCAAPIPDQAAAPVRYDPLMAWKTFGQSFVTLLVVGAVAFAAAPALATTVFFARGASSPFAGTRFDGELDAATNRIYSLGFRTTGGGTDGSVWYYDVASKTYTDTGVDMPVPISNYGIAALTDPTGLGFYVFGGRDPNGNIVTTVQAYYPATNTTAG